MHCPVVTQPWTLLIVENIFLRIFPRLPLYPWANVGKNLNSNDILEYCVQTKVVVDKIVYTRKTWLTVKIWIDHSHQRRVTRTSCNTWRLIRVYVYFNSSEHTIWVKSLSVVQVSQYWYSDWLESTLHAMTKESFSLDIGYL